MACHGLVTLPIGPDSINIAALGTLTIVSAVYQLLQAKRSDILSRLRPMLKAAFRTAAVHWISGSHSPLSRKYAEEYEKSRQRYMKLGTLCLCVMHALVSTMIIAGHLLGLEPGPGQTRWWWYVWTGWGAFAVLANAFPCIHSVRGFPLSYWIAVAFMCAFILPMDSITREETMVGNSVIMMALIMLSPAGGLSSILGSFIYTIVAIFSFSSATGETYIDSTAFAKWFISIGFEMVVLGSGCILMYVASGVRIAIESQAVLSERQAVSSLLDIVCDAVVELDSAGKIMSQSLNLSNLLLKQGQSMQGTEFQSLMYTEEDKKLLNEQWSEVSTGKSAMVRHVDMRDAWGSRIKMEIFQVPFAAAADSATKYLVGIKEQADFERAGAPAEATAPMPVLSLTDAALASLEDRQSSDTASRASDELSSASQVESQMSWERSKRSLSRAEERFQDRLMPTTERAMDLSLLNAMICWNIRSRASHSCCPLHAAVAQLQKAAKRARRLRCNRNFRSQSEWQCSECGIMNEDYLEEETGSCSLCAGIQRAFPTLREGGPRRDNRRRLGLQIVAL